MLDRSHLMALINRLPRELRFMGMMQSKRVQLSEALASAHLPGCRRRQKETAEELIQGLVAEISHVTKEDWLACIRRDGRLGPDKAGGLIRRHLGRCQRCRTAVDWGVVRWTYRMNESGVFELQNTASNPLDRLLRWNIAEAEDTIIVYAYYPSSGRNQTLIARPGQGPETRRYRVLVQLVEELRGRITSWGEAKETDAESWCSWRRLSELPLCTPGARTHAFARIEPRIREPGDPILWLEQAG